MDLWSIWLEEDASRLVGLTSKIPNLIRVPLIYQADSYGCGAAALQSVLYFYGQEYQYKDLEKALKTTPENGTDHRDLLAFCEDVGLNVELKKAMSALELQDLIDAGQPVILVIQAWGDPKILISGWDNGHYVVCVGYDTENFYFMDPSTLGHYAYIPREEFVGRWHDQDGKIKLVHAGIIITGEKKYDPDEVPKIQ